MSSCIQICDKHDNYILETTTAETLVLSCLDFRYIDRYTQFLDDMGLCKRYDQYICTGAELGVLTNELYSKVFLDHVDIAIKLHDIREILLFSHEDCGAYKLHYGKDTKQLHIKNINLFKQYIDNNYSDMKVTCYLMDICGNVEEI